MKIFAANNINLLIDFLKYIKIKASDIIHIQNNEVEFQKDILYDFRDKPADKDDSKDDKTLAINDANKTYISKTQKNESISNIKKQTYEILKKIIEKEKEDNNSNSDNNISKPLKISADNETQRIKNIFNYNNCS